MVENALLSLTKLWHPYHRPEVKNGREGLAENPNDLANLVANRDDNSRSHRLATGL